MKIWAWGANKNGQLGLGTKTEQESTPQEVKIPSIYSPLNPESFKPVKITGGAYHTLLLVDGIPEPYEFIEVTPYFQVLPYPHVRDIACGWNFCLLLDSRGHIHSFGDNSYSQLGRVLDPVSSSGDCNAKNNNVKKQYVPKWSKSTNPSDLIQLTNISAGMRHAAGINFTKQMYVWGDNSKNQLGPSTIPPNTTKVSKVDHPTRVIFPTNETSFDKVRCGRHFTLALGGDSCLFGCGQNKYGVLLHAPQDFKDFKGFTHIYEQIPNRVFSDMIKDFQCGWNHALVLLNNGQVISWGRNDLGQLGRKSVNPEFDVEPGNIIFPEGIVSIACGSEHSLALGRSGKVYAWGWNEHDNCGVKSPTDEKERGDSDNLSDPEIGRAFKKDCILFPIEVPFPQDVKVSVIGCGNGSSFAISV